VHRDREPLSVAYAFGLEHVLPVISEFAKKFPHVVPDVHFDNRSVDLIAEGFDVAIGGGIELTQGVVAREFVRVHAVAVASPEYMARRAGPTQVSDLATMDGISRRSPQSGRVRSWMLRTASGEEAPVEMKARAILSDPEAMCRAASLGMGVAIVPYVHALPYLDRGALIRLLPKWHADVGGNFIYYSSSRLMPAKTRAFVDFFLNRMHESGVKRRFSPA
jgi:DNA-binding transcriptional LysR family regulator